MKTNRFARLSLALLAGVSVMTLASIADAQQAYVSVRTTLRAGPDRGYPQVAWLGGGTTVYVNGCVRGYHWCDVTAGGARGWANARHLQYYHHNRRVAIYGNGATYGFPVVGFALGSYWDNHYRSQAWYNNRSHWNSWHPGRPAPRFDNYPAPRPHYAQPHAVAPAPRRARMYARSRRPMFIARSHTNHRCSIRVRMSCSNSRSSSALRHSRNRVHSRRGARWFRSRRANFRSTVRFDSVTPA